MRHVELPKLYLQFSAALIYPRQSMTVESLTLLWMSEVTSV